ncbi:MULTISPECIES: hypothetical protein [unclassified Bradyrhizobium]|uniref:hypothetical protein n=1 Tax=unclassified Bradyrhizobium TaxID=2631580 RepID=UPI001FFAFB00|nr:MULTISPECIES: hypothetical protein [unclassified Bradyrhizobium]
MGTRGSSPGRSRQGSRLAGLTREAATRPIGGIHQWPTGDTQNQIPSRAFSATAPRRLRQILLSPSQSNWSCEKYGLGSKASQIVAEGSYELADPTIDSQIIQLKAEETLIRQATSLHGERMPLMLPGVSISTELGDYTAFKVLRITVPKASRICPSRQGADEHRRSSDVLRDRSSSWRIALYART